jgi:mannose-6-phosphate isomerase-like protein (cupin superfamily)
MKAPMKHAQMDFLDEFAVVTGNDRSQAAVMVLPPGESTGDSENRHSGSDQWLYVVSGEGSASIDGQVHILRPGSLLLIERGETHEIQSQGDEPLQTLNFYVPPAYSSEGEPLPSGKG